MCKTTFKLLSKQKCNFWHNALIFCADNKTQKAHQIIKLINRFPKITPGGPIVVNHCKIIIILLDGKDIYLLVPNEY